MKKSLHTKLEESLAQNHEVSTKEGAEIISRYFSGIQYEKEEAKRKAHLKKLQSEDKATREGMINYAMSKQGLDEETAERLLTNKKFFDEWCGLEEYNH